MTDEALEEMVEKAKGGMVAAIPTPTFQDLVGELISLRRESKRWRPKCRNYRNAIRGLQRCVDRLKAARYEKVHA